MRVSILPRKESRQECGEKVFRSINAGKITRKHNAKFHALGRTLELLTTLDEDHLKHIVKTYLAHTEFTNLIDDKNILTV